MLEIKSNSSHSIDVKLQQYVLGAEVFYLNCHGSNYFKRGLLKACKYLIYLCGKNLNCI